MASRIILRYEMMPLNKQITTSDNSRPTSVSMRRPSRSARCAEVAGGTAAECAVVCCCCPCGLVNLIILVFVRLPAGLCRKAIKKRKKRRKLLASQHLEQSEDAKLPKDDIELIKTGVPHISWTGKSPSDIVLEMEKEMTSKIFGTGFWRSLSDREDS